MYSLLRIRVLANLAASVVLFSGCDEAKKFIDPSGKAYNTPPDTSKKAEIAKQEAAKPAPSAAKQSSGPVWETAKPGPATNRASSTFRDVPPMSPQEAMTKARDMLMTSPNGWVEFHNGSAQQGGRRYTLWNETEAPWGLGIVDLDQDGADDAIFAVRGQKGGKVTWSLAVLLDRKGSLQCIQSIPLPEVEEITSLEATPGGVLVTPSTGRVLLFGWLGGELVGNP